MKKNIIETLKSRGLVNPVAAVTEIGWMVKTNLPVPLNLFGCKNSSMFHEHVADAMNLIDFDIDGFVTEDLRINSENDYEFTLIPVTEKYIRKFMTALMRNKYADSKETALAAMFYMIRRIKDKTKRESAESILMDIRYKMI